MEQNAMPEFENNKKRIEALVASLNAASEAYYGGKEEIRKVAFCTGAGGDFIYTAVREGCDAYITGDLKLHEAQYAKAVGLTVIDAGHYGTEKIFTPNMAAQIRAQAGRSLEVLEAESNTNPYTL